MYKPELNQPSLEFEAVKKELMALLTKHAIPFEQWGTGSAKTLDHLVKEIMEGESVLIEEESGELIRRLSIASIHVSYTDASGKQLILKETKQVFRGGRERRRAMEDSLAEKLKASESPDQKLVQRALGEELGIESDAIVRARDTKEVVQDSVSFPGLPTRLTKHYFDAELNESQFKPEGYVEHQSDKSTYFEWSEA